MASVESEPMKTLVVALVLLIPRAAAAEVVVWVDAQGVEHYTNVPEEIPKAYRGATRVVVRAMPRREEVELPAPSRRERDRPERQRLAQIVFDRPARSDDYVRGFVEGFSHGHGDTRTGDIHIQGPLAISDAGTRYPVSLPYYFDSYPLVTTAFDRGRSRHQTLRMLLQDQFQLDRGWPWPYAYPARVVPPRAGIDLTPFHPRGLPRRFPRETRVIMR